MMKGLVRKALEPDENHELNDVLLSPNSYQAGDQLWQTTFLWMAVRGELMWVLTNENDEPLVGNEAPAKIWPISGDFFEPIQETPDRGELVGWKMKVPNWLPQAITFTEMNLPLEAVVQFKYPNLATLLRGQSRLGPSTNSILMDLKYQEHNRRILENRGDPGGIIESEMTMDPDEEQEYLQSWDQRHKGQSNANRTAILSGGFKYTQVGLSPIDMQGLEAQRWNREGLLAGMAVPPSVLGVTDFVNYATQLGQDKNFWDKNIIPLMNLIETTLDGTLFFTQPDNVMGLFDLTDIEALRSGINEKIDIAVKLSKPELHVPPKLAFETVGLEIEEYEGDEDVFINPALTTVENAIDQIENPPEPIVMPPPGTGDDDGANPPPAPSDTVPPAIGEGEGTREAQSLLQKRITQYKISRWESFQKVQDPHERGFRQAYLRWINAEKKANLEIFDEQTKALGLRGWHVAKQDESLVTLPENVLPELQDTQNRLQVQTHPQYVAASQTIVSFTADGDLGGIPVFDLDDEAFNSIIVTREQFLLTKTPMTLRNALIQTVGVGIQNGETIRQIRNRINGVYAGMATPVKTLQVARTETASLMNTTRDEMFKQQGFTEEIWSTAGDEIVRADHVTFGKATPKPRGFNYMDLASLGGFGVLEFPGDSRAPANQVVNCRCLKLPVK
jgi:hypothetical protein